MSSPAFAGISAVLFDLLHTLVDDSGFPRYQLRKMLQTDGCDFDPDGFEQVYNSLTAKEYDWESASVEKPFRTMKDRHVSRLEKLYRLFGLEDRRDLAADIELLWEKIASSNVYAEVPSLLPAIQDRGYRLALVSNADIDDPVLKALRRADLGIGFDAVVTSQKAGSYKPDAAIFKLVLAELGLEPRDVVMVGDNPVSDVMGASELGISTIWVNRRGSEFPSGIRAPDATVTSLSGMLDLLPGPLSNGR